MGKKSHIRAFDPVRNLLPLQLVNERKHTFIIAVQNRRLHLMILCHLPKISILRRTVFQGNIMNLRLFCFRRNHMLAMP